MPLEIVCYLCQQSAEKILKAYILAKEGPLVKTHDLYALIEQCRNYDQQFTQILNKGNELTDYEALTRYPAYDAITEDDMHQALADAKDILEFTQTKLQSRCLGQLE